MKTCFFLLSFIIATQALASDFHSPRTAALGGAGHAGPLLNDALYLNPSFASFMHTYSISLNYLPFSGDQGLQGRHYNLSVQDGRTELFQAGVGFTKKANLHYIHIGASKVFLTRYGFGLGTKILINNSTHQSTTDLIASFTWIPASWLYVAAIVDHLLEAKEFQSEGLYREIILGTKWNIVSTLLLYLDPHWTPSLSQAFGFETGIELTPFKDFFLRFGRFYRSSVPFLQARGHGYGMGFGWLGPRLSIDYGFEKVLHREDGGAKGSVHSVGLTLYF